jgi:hypothetical protein
VHNDKCLYTDLIWSLPYSTLVFFCHNWLWCFLIRSLRSSVSAAALVSNSFCSALSVPRGKCCLPFRLLHLDSLPVLHCRRCLSQAVLPAACASLCVRELRRTDSSTALGYTSMPISQTVKLDQTTPCYIVPQRCLCNLFWLIGFNSSKDKLNSCTSVHPFHQLAQS